MATPDPDPFDTLLTLESQFHLEGYNLGVADGTRAGRTEGRIFGLEKGYEKFAEMGRLNGRAAVWNARLSSTDPGNAAVSSSARIRPLKGSERLARHIHRLKDLTDVATLSTENSEDAVAEFDDRLRDGNAKAVLISRIVGEDLHAPSSPSASSAGSEQHSKGPRKTLRVRKPDGDKRTGEMEDFAGLPGAAKLSSRGQNP